MKTLPEFVEAYVLARASTCKENVDGAFVLEARNTYAQMLALFEGRLTSSGEMISRNDFARAIPNGGGNHPPQRCTECE